ncbi:hypothetical protein ACHAP3_005415 [Botrytis cinerea]
MVKSLLENGAEINAKCDRGLTSLYRATCEGYETIVELLLERGGEFDLLAHAGCNMLLGATFRGHEAIVAILLKQITCTEVENKDSNELLLKAKDEKGHKPLVWATRHRYEDMVKLLLDKGADIESKDNCGCTPLIYALLCGRPYMPIVKKFLDYDADANAEDDEGQTPLSVIKRNPTLIDQLEKYIPGLKIDR